MIPLPCCLPWVTVTRRRRLLRDAVFIIIAAGCFAVGLEILPSGWIGW